VGAAAGGWAYDKLGFEWGIGVVMAAQALTLASLPLWPLLNSRVRMPRRNPTENTPLLS